MNKYKKKVSFSQNNCIFEMDNYDRTNDELTSIILNQQRFSTRIKVLEEKLIPILKSKVEKIKKFKNNKNPKLTYNKKIYNKMARPGNEQNPKMTYNKKNL